MLNISWPFRTMMMILLGLVFLAGFTGAQQPDAAPVAEESPLLTEPESPEDAFKAASLMQRLGRPNLAKRYLKQFLASNPDEAALLKLRDKSGPAVFLRLANDPGLRPESKTLLDRVNAAFRKRGADPQQINKLISDLSGGPRERAVALETLRSGGTVVVPQMLKSLATANNTEKSVLISALVQMGQPVVPPLLGALESPNEGIRGAAIEALGHLGAENVVPYLWRPAFGPNESPATSEAARNALSRILKPEGRRNFQVSPYGAVAQIKKVALQHFRNEYPWFLKDDQTTVKIWTWNPQTQTVAPVEMSPRSASLYRGSLLTRDALILSPNDQETQALFLGFVLAEVMDHIGWNAPLPTGPNTAFQLCSPAEPMRLRKR